MEKNAKNIISETHRPDGTLATRIIKTDEGTFLIQYDRDGQVTFSEKMPNKYELSSADVTYHNGTVATITRHDPLKHTKTVTQYDEKGHAVASIDLNEDDIVNFAKDGRILSIVKHIKKYGGLGPTNEIEELQFDENGRIVSLTHKVKMTSMWSAGEEKWMTTESKQYHDNGTLASLITYKQKTKRSPTSNTGNFELDVLNSFMGHHEDEAASYISSITQYNDAGKVQIAAQLGEFDEISFNGEKVACITRRQPDGAHDIISQTTYYATGQICTVTQYKDNKVVSSITYDENGKPTSSAQQGNEEHQNIFAQAQKTEQTNKKDTFDKGTDIIKNKPAAKAIMVPSAAMKILGLTDIKNLSKEDLARAYEKKKSQCDPGDQNQLNQIQAAFSSLRYLLKIRDHQQQNR